MSELTCLQDGCGQPRYNDHEYCLDHWKNQESYAYGLDAELQKKIAGKYDPNRAEIVKNWLETIIKEKFEEPTLQEALKSGIRLCQAVNVIKPGTIKKINTLNTPFKHRENITLYLNACKTLGMNQTDLFVSQDLYDGANMVMVVDQIMALGGLARSIPTFQGPYIGVKRKELPDKEIELSGARKVDFNIRNPTELKKAKERAAAMEEKMESDKKCEKSGCERFARVGKAYCTEHYKELDNFAYGLDAELQDKIAQKFDPEKAAQAQDWLETLVGEEFNEPSMQDALKSGERLCAALNKIKSGLIPNYTKGSSQPFKHRENIELYLKGCKMLGMAETDLFVSQSLYEGANMVMVVDNIFALAGLAQRQPGYSGPTLGKARIALPDRKITITGHMQDKIVKNRDSQPVLSSKRESDADADMLLSKAVSAATGGGGAAAAASASSAGAVLRFCGDCGEPRTTDDIRFCGECGAKFDD